MQNKIAFYNINEHVRQIKYYLTQKKGSELIELISDEFNKIGNKDTLFVLLEVCKQQDPYILGSVIFHSIFKKLCTDDNFFIDLLDVIKKRSQKKAGLSIDINFRLIAIDFLNSASRKRKSGDKLWETYFDSLRKIALSNISLPASFQAKTIRILAKDKSLETLKVIQKNITSEKQILVDAAAHVLASWSKDQKELEPNLFHDSVNKLIKYSNNHQREALQSQGIINALANINTTPANSVLINLIKKAETTKEIVTLLSIINSKIESDLIAKVIQKIMINNKKTEFDYLKGIIKTNPSFLKSLFENEHFEEFLFSISTAKSIGYKEGTDHLKKLCQSTNPRLTHATRITARALSALEQKPPFQKGVLKVKPIDEKSSFRNRSLRELYKAILGEAQFKELNDNIQSTSYIKFLNEKIYVPEFQSVAKKDQIEGSSSSTQGKIYNGKSYFYMADALYKNLSKVGQVTGDHWHAGLHLGFYPMIIPKYSPIIGHFIEYANTVCLKGIHMNNISYGIEYFTAYRTISGPSWNISTYMGNVYQSYKQQFEQGDGYPGRRSPENLSGTERRKITGTAVSLYGKIPWWTFADMLAYEGFHWDGSPDDILALRCDGLVEYSYEKNNHRVCGGRNSAYWNISRPDKKNAENHNDFHTGTYEHGEICPKIQAGDEGNDSTFKNLSVAIPEIITFVVMPCLIFMPPIIYFEVDAFESDVVYVRITVSKDGSPFYFIIADDIITNEGKPYLEYPIGPTTFMELNKKDYICWLGKTLNGPDFWGKEGNYEFRIVIVDAGGNVSPTLFLKKEFKIGLTAGWSQSSPPNRISDGIY